MVRQDFRLQAAKARRSFDLATIRFIFRQLRKTALLIETENCALAIAYCR
jgi:hypothetical protein